MIIDFYTHILPPFLKERRADYIARDATLAINFAMWVRIDCFGSAAFDT